jgi:hypothetical protein
MNKVTEDIMNRYGIPKWYAIMVQKKMETSWLDFSECSKEEYDIAMWAAYQKAILNYIREKECCVCWWTARGIQRPNRDTWFGLCPGCAKQEIVKHSVEDMVSSYGYLWINYFL